MTGSDKQNVLHPSLLKCLAMTAAVHKRTLDEELGVAVQMYLTQEFEEHGVDEIAERAFSDQPTAA